MARLRAEGTGPTDESQAKAEILRWVRSARRRRNAEDYVQIIAELVATTGEARLTDVARKLDISHATVNCTIARLKKQGLVTAKPYRAIYLTDEGRRVAAEMKRRRDVIIHLLNSLGVPQAEARSDADGMEHYISKETLTAFSKFCERRQKESHGATLTDRH